MQRLFSLSTRTVGTRALRCTTSCQPFNMNRRFITEDSWAAEQLTKKGEKLGPGVAGDMLVTESMVFNATPKVKELAEKFLELNAVEAAQLLKVIQSRIGVSDSMLEGFFGGGGAARPAAGGDVAADTGDAKAAEPAKPKEAWDLKLVSFDASSKIKIIKEIRAMTGLGLKEAKEMSEKALPVVLKSGVKKEDAEKFQGLIKAAGGVLELV